VHDYRGGINDVAKDYHARSGLLARAKRVIAMRDADHLQEDGQRDVGVAWGLERENPRGRMV